MNSPELKKRALSWLQESAFPFWLAQEKQGVFPEAIDSKGNSLSLPLRTMVHSRMVYCLAKGIDLDLVVALPQLKRTANFILSLQNSNGSFPHSFDENKKVLESRSELYTQAFILFALGNAQRIDRSRDYEAPALRLLNYLNRERKIQAGGFSEIDTNGNILFLSNPHMHLFEALLVWSENGQSPEWKVALDDLFRLFKTKFIQSDGRVAEYFDSAWSVEKVDGKYLWEPGHQYEWSWLLSEMDRVLQTDSRKIQTSLFQATEGVGICPKRKVAYDQLDSALAVTKSTSRYWPQAERVKAALAMKTPESLLAADEAMEKLLQYLGTPAPGQCYDNQLDSGQFSKELARASFFYHVINAMDEFIRYR